MQLFIDVQVPPPHLLIVGAGRIPTPLAEIGHICDFEVTVLDNQPRYSPSVFLPPIVSLRGRLPRNCGGCAGQPTFDENTYLVLVTRGHQYDVACLLKVLDDQSRISA